MMRELMRFLLLVVIATALGAGGCSSGVKVGDQWVVRPHAAQTASQLQIRRFSETTDDGPSAKLDIDLFTGRTSLTDLEGRIHPSQLDHATTEKLRESLSGRAWQSRRTRAAKDADQVVRYEAEVRDGERRIGRTARWVTPSAKPLPDALTMLARTFERADRMVHPLSDRIDLVR
ncbi:MAG: hypothetical protein CMJ18_23625 [Phycisphaeraceae bacterium]|nr:hypothetical protein [Phycisphaeraceae bacterium]